MHGNVQCNKITHEILRESKVQIIIESKERARELEGDPTLYERMWQTRRGGGGGTGWP